jgi:hypothetical protein
MQKLKPFMSAKHKKRRRGDATPEASTARGAVRCEFYADDEEAVRYTATGRQTLVQQVCITCPAPPQPTLHPTRPACWRQRPCRSG